MKPNKPIHILFTGIACASFLVYILACGTSFSPDDSQVLYPAFDRQSYAVAVAVYDRAKGRSETIFTPIAPTETITNQYLLLARAQWLADGKHILVGHTLGDHKGIGLHLLPRGVNGPVRHLPCLEVDEPLAALELPFVVVGSQLFLRTAANTLVRLDLMTGEVFTREFTNDIWVLPAPDGKTVIGYVEAKGEKGGVLGAVDQRTLEFAPVTVLTNEPAEGTIPAFDPASGRTAYVYATKESPELRILTNGNAAVTRALTREEGELIVGPLLDFTPDGGNVLTTYRFEPANQTNAEYGLLEIPLSEQPLRWTPLFYAEARDDAGFLYAQASLSHDGTVWAIATPYLYIQNESLKPDDCALYLVEIGRAKPKVNKVPIAPPRHRGSFSK